MTTPTLPAHGIHPAHPQPSASGQAEDPLTRTATHPPKPAPRPPPVGHPPRPSDAAAVNHRRQHIRQRPRRFLDGASDLLCARQDSNLQPSDP
ncbi:hypothetical protein CG747_42465 [Streptomyces sp. CB02959]|nr:hypothetical protein CG747_42465 [Streptomyces sp. CB02959]